MSIKNRFSTFLLACAVLALSGAAAAQQFPIRPIKLVVPFAPGGGTDLLGRIVGQKMSEGLGQPVVVENRAGAGGQIGTAYAAKAPPDGHTIVIVSTPTTIHHSLYKTLPYDILNDFAPVSLMVLQPLLLVVHPSVPARTVQELIAYAKAQPGKLNFSSSGNGTGMHLAGELLKSLAGIDMVHVPYGGAGPALTAVVAGQITMAFDQPGTSLGHIQSGRLRPLAVTSRGRSAQLPSTPTLEEAGVPGYVVDSWFGVVTAVQTPKPIVERLSTEVSRALHALEVREKLTQQGFVVVGGTPQQFAAFMKDDVAKWRRVIEVSGTKAD